MKRKPLLKNLTDAHLLDYFKIVLFQQQISGLAAKTFSHPLSKQSFDFAINTYQNVEHACKKRGLDLETATQEVIAAVHSSEVEANVQD